MYVALCMIGFIVKRIGQETTAFKKEIKNICVLRNEVFDHDNSECRRTVSKQKDDQLDKQMSQ